jgi:hypothetical protein
MPNWVYNSIIIEGSADGVAELCYELTRPRPSGPNGEMTEPVDKFSFWNIEAPLDLDAYFVTVGTGEDSVNLSDACDQDNWFEWNYRHWGTKWDACRPEHEFVADDNNGMLTLRFETAWDAPRPIYNALIERCRDENWFFTVFYEEETGWGGEMELDASGVLKERNWHINPYTAQEKEGDEDLAPWTEETTDAK